jgi:hypothetical protein
MTTIIRDETKPRLWMAVTVIISIVVFITLAGNVVFSSEFRTLKAAVRRGANLPKPPTPVVQAVLAVERPQFWSGGVRGAIRQILTPGHGRLWLSPPECNALCRAKRVAVLALGSHLYGREAILRGYIATVYMGEVDGQTVWGLHAAAHVYFHRDLTAMDVPKAAMLAGMIWAPNLLSPRFPERAVARRNVVLKRMLDENFITRPEYDRASTSPLVVAA